MSTSNGPGLFSDIGKKVRDLLTQYYNTKKKFSVGTHSVANGLELASTAMDVDGECCSSTGAEYVYKNTLIQCIFLSDVSEADGGVYRASRKLSTIFTFNEIVPATTAIAELYFPGYNTSKLEVKHFHDYAALNASVYLKQSPVIDVSATIGTPSIAIGGEAGYDTKSGTFSKYSAGLSAQKSDACASIILGDKRDAIRASYLHYLDKAKVNSVAGEVTRKFSTNENIVTVGGQCSLNPLTVVKGKLDSYGTVGAVLQHMIIPKSWLTVSAQVNTKALDVAPKIGMSLALKA